MTVGQEGGASGTARPGGRLRRVAGGRRRVVKVLLSPEEEEWLVPRAAAMGLSVQRLLVESAMGGGPGSVLARRTLYAEFLAARRDLHGAATNLNQLARLGNEVRAVPAGVPEAVQRVEAAQVRMGDLAGRVAGHVLGSDESVVG